MGVERDAIGALLKERRELILSTWPRRKAIQSASVRMRAVVGQPMSPQSRPWE
jgi:hypothetical protein